MSRDYSTQDSFLKTGVSASGTSTPRNRVLRNTYWLLGISMIPTVLGSYLGLEMGFSFFVASPIMSLLLFLSISFGFFYLINRFKNSVLGVLSLLGFTFFLGFMLSRLLGVVLGMSNGHMIVMAAFGGTALVFSAMAFVATVSKREFSGLSQWLFTGVLVLFVLSLANMWLQLSAVAFALSALAIPLFSAYLLYDLRRIIVGGETNYVIATLSVYLDLYNIFSNILFLLGLFSGNDRN